MYIYLDESGDLGFNINSSQHIIIALLITKSPHKIERCIKRIRQRKLKKKLKELPEIKFNNSDSYIREKTLECIAKEAIEIAYVALNKKNVNPNNRYHNGKIYNFIAGHIMSSLPYENHTKTKLIVDKRISNKIIRTGFDHYIKQETSFKVEIVHENSQLNKCLQATDFIVGAIFRKYESGDSKYYDIIKNNIKIAEHLP